MGEYISRQNTGGSFSGRYPETGDDYSEFENDGTLTFNGEATVWDDLRVSVETMNTDGAHSPDVSLFKNQGGGAATSNAFFSLLQYGGGTVSIPSHTSYDFQSAFTIEFWYFFDNNTSDWTNIFNKSSELRIRNRTNGSLALQTDIGYTTTASGEITRNAWNHIMVTYTGNGGTGNDTFKLYTNNHLALTQTGWGSTTGNTNPLEFNDDYTPMGIDNFVFTQHVYTSTERDDAYNSGDGKNYTGTETDLKGLWKFNETSGAVAVDTHATGNNGSIDGVENTNFKWDLGLVSSVSGSLGTRIYVFNALDHHEVFFSVQVPHSWKEGTALQPHVHIVGLKDTETATPLFGLEYTKAKPGGTFGDTTIIEGSGYSGGSDTTKDKHQLILLPEIDMTGDTISTMLLCRLYRDPNNVLDTYTGNIGLLEFDFHFEKDMQGSRAEWTK